MCRPAPSRPSAAARPARGPWPGGSRGPPLGPRRRQRRVLFRGRAASATSYTKSGFSTLPRLGGPRAEELGGGGADVEGVDVPVVGLALLEVGAGRDAEDAPQILGAVAVVE